MPTYEFGCKACGHITDFSCGFIGRPNSILCSAEGCTNRAKYQISTGTRPIGGGTPIFHGHQKETLGDLFDKGGVRPGSKANKKANRERIKKMREKHD